MSDSTEAQRLGQAIRNRRRELNLTQEKLAAEVGYGQGGGVTVSRIEHGVISPPLSRLSRIAEALQTTPEELYADAGLGASRSSRLRSVAKRVAVGPQAEENAALEEEILKEAELLDELTGEATKELVAAHDRVRDEFLLPFIAATARIPDIREHLTTDPQEPEHPTEQQRLELQHARLKRELVRSAGLTAAGAGAGAAAGGVAAYGALTATAAWATASTGTAISALSGAAASSATLAALGGGSLASGGLGVAGGAALLSGLIAVPALGVMGVVAYRQRKRLNERERDGNAELRAIQNTQATFGNDLQQFATWAGRAAAIFEKIRSSGLKPLVRLEVRIEDEDPSAPLPLDRFDEKEQDVIAQLLDLASLQLGVSSLPMASILSDRELSTENRKAIAEWNELVLSDAEGRLGLASPLQTRV
ncbi:MAG: helix-turn-helix transcriptional regulator [Micrococcales bacterium]|nr:helix-turn-helix transcriptional regulator [Micrococcales bacterium]